MADVTQDRVERPVDAPPWWDGVAYGIERISGAREPTIPQGADGQYWRWDKTWADLTADAVAFVPAGGISAENMQAAIEELDAEKLSLTSVSAYMLTLLDDASASAARGTLGLGALAIRDTVNNDYWTGLDLAVENGGTGASTAAAARTNLGVQPTGSPTFTGTATFDQIHATGAVTFDADVGVGGLLIADDIRIDDGNVATAAAVASTHRLRIRINTVQYDVLLKQV